MTVHIYERLAEAFILRAVRDAARMDGWAGSFDALGHDKVLALVAEVSKTSSITADAISYVRLKAVSASRAALRDAEADRAYFHALEMDGIV